MERQAEPEPRRASRDRLGSSRLMPAAFVAASARAANPAAEEAIPAAVGKLLSLITSAWECIPAIRRTSSRKSETRCKAAPFFLLPLSMSESFCFKSEKFTVVRVSRPARFMEMEPLTGRRRASSRLPQYLMKAMLGCAKACEVKCGWDALPETIREVYHEDTPFESSVITNFFYENP